MLIQSSPQIEEFISSYFVALVTQLPLFLVYLGGIVVALVVRRKHPKAALFTILAMVVLLFESVVMPGVQIWLPRYWLAQANSPRELRTVMGIVGALRNLIGAIGLGFLLLAVFSGRSSNPAQPKSALNSGSVPEGIGKVTPA